MRKQIRRRFLSDIYTISHDVQEIRVLEEVSKYSSRVVKKSLMLRVLSEAYQVDDCS